MCSLHNFFLTCIFKLPWLNSTAAAHSVATFFPCYSLLVERGKNTRLPGLKSSAFVLKCVLIHLKVQNKETQMLNLLLTVSLKSGWLAVSLALTADGCLLVFLKRGVATFCQLRSSPGCSWALLSLKRKETLKFWREEWDSLKMKRSRVQSWWRGCAAWVSNGAGRVAGLPREPAQLPVGEPSPQSGFPSSVWRSLWSAACSYFI